MSVKCGILAGRNPKSAKLFDVRVHAPRRCAITAVAADLIGQTDVRKSTNSAETAMQLSLFGETRTCRRCGEVKPLTGFAPVIRNGITYRSHTCAACRNTALQARRRARTAAARALLPPIEEIREKRCSRCGLILPLGEFGPDKGMRLGVRSACRKCDSESAMEWKDKNYEKDWDRRLRKNFGITLEQYREMLRDQGGVCAICGEPPAIIGYRPSRRQGRPRRPMLVVDHDHETGKVRGLLCIHCNRGIGFLKDSPDIVRLALKYLEERG